MKNITRIFTFILVLTILAVQMPAPTYAANYTATIDIDTSALNNIGLGFRGFNNANTWTAATYDDPNYINKMKEYGQLGYVRFPGGTNTNAFNWKTGAIDEEYLGQLTYEEDKYYDYTDDKKVTETKGYERLEAYREYIQQTGVKAMITVNVLESTPKEAGELAKYCYDNNIPVIYFELGNEIHFFVEECSDKIQHYRTGNDYLVRMREFDTAIKNNYPGAKTVVVMSNNGSASSFNEDFKTFANPFWDGATFHRYEGKDMNDVNETLHTWFGEYQYYLNNLPDPNTPIYIGEFGVDLQEGVYNNQQYHGIFLAESILRLSRYANITHIGGYRLQEGAMDQGNMHLDEMKDAYQRNLTVDTKQFNFDFYRNTPAASTQIVDNAINKSSKRYSSTTTGGASVNRTNGTMSALFAEAYRGDDGKDYVVIVNKSNQTHDVTIKKNGVNVSAAMVKTYVTAADPTARNTASDKTNVAAQTVSTGNPVFIPEYSVTRVEWTRSTTPDAPAKPWLSHANISSGKVDLKWHASQNATGYKVKYGTTSGNLTNVVNVGNTASYSVTGLTNGATYYFAITAYNAAGESANSNEVSSKMAVPSVPTITNYHAKKTGRAVVEWKSVPHASGYKIKYGTTSGSYTNTIDAGNNVGYIIKGLNNNQAYYFVVTAYNGYGESANSGEFSVAPKVNLPLAPNNLRVASETTTDITITWDRTKTQRGFDNFESGNTSNWNADVGTWGIVPHPDPARATNVYISPAAAQGISVFNNLSGDMEGSADILVESAYGTNSQVGIVARYTDSNNYYRFVYNAPGDNFRLVKMKNGVSYPLGAIDRTAAGINNTSKMTLRLDVEGSKMTAKVNNKTILTATDSDLTGGYFGLFTNNQEAYFDGFRLMKDNANSFDIYRSTSPYTGFTRVRSGVTGTTASFSGLNVGEAYYFKIKAVNEAGESYNFSSTVKKK